MKRRGYIIFEDSRKRFSSSSVFHTFHCFFSTRNPLSPASSRIIISLAAGECVYAYLMDAVCGVCCAGRPTTTATAITVSGTTKLLRKMEIQALDNSQADASSGGGKTMLSSKPSFFRIFSSFSTPSHLTTHCTFSSPSTSRELFWFIILLMYVS